MRHGYWLLGVVAAVTLCWCGWDSLAPTPEPSSLPVANLSHAIPTPPRQFVTPPEPPEVIDISSAFAPIAEEDRVATVNELLLVGYTPSVWLGNLFTGRQSPAAPEVWEFKGGDLLPTGKEAKTPTMEVRPSDVPAATRLPAVQ